MGVRGNDERRRIERLVELAQGIRGRTEKDVLSRDGLFERGEGEKRDDADGGER